MGKHLSSSHLPQLPMRALGATGAVLPILGFGVSGVLASPLVSQAQVNNLTRTARRLGITVFDTAPFYGDGVAEQRLKIALEKSNDTEHLPPPFIITKAGTHRVGRKMWKDFSIKGLRAQLSDSKSRLPHIDAFFLHGPSENDLTPQLLAELQKLKQDGLFKYLGIAGRGHELDKAISSNSFDLIMAPIHRNLPFQDLERLEKAQIQNLGVIGIEALAPAAQGIRLSLNPSDMWYSARAILHGKGFQKQQMTAHECLNWVKHSGLADIILSTTSRIEHLHSNAASCSDKLEIPSR